MCEPMTIAAVAMAAGSVMQGYAAKQQGEYANDVAKYNARQQENEAQMVRKQGTEAENRQRERTVQLMSQQRAQIGASGVDISSGSPLQLQQDAAMLGEADARLIRSNTGFQQQALMDQSELTRSHGKAQKQAGQMAFVSSLGMAAGAAAGGVNPKWFTSGSAAAGAGFGVSLGNNTSFGPSIA